MFLLGRLIALSLQAGLNFAVFVGLRGLPSVASSLRKHFAKFYAGLSVQSRARQYAKHDGKKAKLFLRVLI
jgi:hypothetical protein